MNLPHLINDIMNSDKHNFRKGEDFMFDIINEYFISIKFPIDNLIYIFTNYRNIIVMDNKLNFYHVIYENYMPHIAYLDY